MATNYMYVSKHFVVHNQKVYWTIRERFFCAVKFNYKIEQPQMVETNVITTNDFQSTRSINIKLITPAIQFKRLLHNCDGNIIYNFIYKDYWRMCDLAVLYRLLHGMGSTPLHTYNNGYRWRMTRSPPVTAQGYLSHTITVTVVDERCPLGPIVHWCDIQLGKRDW